MLDLGTGALLQLSYTGGDGNNVVLTGVPEPGTMLALLAMVGLVTGHRTRQPTARQ